MYKIAMFYDEGSLQVFVLLLIFLIILKNFKSFRKLSKAFFGRKNSSEHECFLELKFDICQKNKNILT